ncbi:RHS repeat protein [Saccharothrix sp. S26]|uniref:RHS repeat-associated core domain-containing protein n=1 Tax=Saccharothrix sp. S26 TaxID=2907215 RepID=UPI001F2EED09|nr:RHS repeat domain-containing protein [Saccharothrix sp. S26]MCE6998454.1 RHS repeat protein [Saccharothrix sp. S26]
MRRSVLRGFVLRVSGSAMAAVLAAGVVIGVAQAAPEGGQAPETWTPSSQVNREPVGGDAPDRDRWPASGGDLQAQRVTCSGADYGILPSYPMERHRISDRLELLVNLDNRNAVLAYRELTVKGTGLNLTVDRFYNTYDGPIPGGDWQLSYDNIGLEVFDGQGVILHGPNGYCEWFAENADGTYAPAPKVDAKLTRTPDGGYVVSFDASDERWLFTAGGWLVSQTDRNGNTVTNRYAPDGKLTSVVDTQGRVTRFNYDDRGRAQSITDPSGTTFGDYTYATSGELIQFTDRGGAQVKLGYAPEYPRELTSITDPRGAVYRLEYDDRGRLTKLTKPTSDGVGVSTTYARTDTYDTIVTDANGNASRHEFDDEGRQVKATDALGHVRSQTWTAASDVNTTTDALSHSTTYQYDSLNNLIGTKLATGAQSVVGYTSSAHPHLPTQVTDASGNQTTREYDVNGNLTKVRSTGLNADIETYTYNARGLVATRKDGKGAITSYTYDTAGNLTQVAPPAPAGATTYTYDSLSRVTSITDGNGVRIDYGYDRLDRVVSVKHGASAVQANTFDANGNLTSTQVPGVTRTLAYDARNQLTKVTRGTEVVSYTYDKVGNLKTLTTPTGTATYGYDAADRLTSLADAYGGTTTFGYDDADRRTTTGFPGGAVQTTGYDNAGRNTSITVTKPGAELFKATYRYTRPDGSDTDKLQSKTIKGVTTDYAYDGLGRLTKAGTGSYTLDNATNVLSGEGRTYTVNAADQYTRSNDTTVGFDGAGNYKSTTNPDSAVTHSPTNQLLTGHLGTTKVLDLAYDTADQTQPRTVTETPTSGTSVTHVFTRTALGVTETVDNGTRSSYTRDTEGVLIGLKDKTGARYGAVTDHQGSVLALVDTNGNLAAEYTYTPYGAVTATGTASASNPFRYLGAYQLQRGHYLLGYRIYEPSFARFFSPDPTGQEPNPYNYAGGDPINNSDPTGGSFGSSGGATIGGGIGGLAAGAFVAAACGTGVGCLPAFALMGGFLGGAGAAIGSAAAGGTQSDISTDGFWGVVSGALFTPLGKLV